MQPVLGTSIVRVFDTTAALTGLTELGARRMNRQARCVTIISNHHAGYYPGAEMMMLKLLFAPQDGRILGAQAVGRAGVEKRIDVLAMAIQKGASVYDLEEAELCYAPQYGSAKDPVNMAGFVAGNLLRGDVEVVHWTEWQSARAADGESPLVVDVRTPKEVAKAAVPGTTTLELDRIARENIERAGARPAFLGYRGFPATLCASVNEEVVHGIPGARKLNEGDIVGLDLGCILEGFFGDSARTVAVGRVGVPVNHLGDMDLKQHVPRT